MIKKGYWLLSVVTRKIKKYINTRCTVYNVHGYKKKTETISHHRYYTTMRSSDKIRQFYHSYCVCIVRYFWFSRLRRFFSHRWRSRVSHFVVFPFFGGHAKRRRRRRRRRAVAVMILWIRTARPGTWSPGTRWRLEIYFFPFRETRTCFTSRCIYNNKRRLSVKQKNALSFFLKIFPYIFERSNYVFYCGPHVSKPLTHGERLI